MDALQQAWNNFQAWALANATLIQTLAALVGMLALAGAILRGILQRRTPASPPAHVVTEFTTLWPKLSPILRGDLAQSIEWATQTRLAANDESGAATRTLNVQLPKIGLEPTYHWKTIGVYDPVLAQQLAQYLKASLELRECANKYNQLSYADRTASQPFADTRASLFGASRRVEEIADTLQAQVTHFDQVIPQR